MTCPICFQKPCICPPHNPPGVPIAIFNGLARLFTNDLFPEDAMMLVGANGTACAVVNIGKPQ